MPQAELIGPLNSLSVGSSYLQPLRLEDAVPRVFGLGEHGRHELLHLVVGRRTGLADRAATALGAGPSPPLRICIGSMPQARRPKKRMTRMMMPLMPPPPGRRGRSECGSGRCCAEAARQAAAALAARILDVVALTTASPKHASFLSGCRPASRAALSNVNGKIAEWFCQVIGFFEDAPVSTSDDAIRARLIGRFAGRQNESVDRSGRRSSISARGARRPGRSRLFRRHGRPGGGCSANR